VLLLLLLLLLVVVELCCCCCCYAADAPLCAAGINNDRRSNTVYRGPLLRVNSRDKPKIPQNYLSVDKRAVGVHTAYGGWRMEDGGGV
jgi:hypothetical protein